MVCRGRCEKGVRGWCVGANMTMHVTMYSTTSSVQWQNIHNLLVAVMGSVKMEKMIRADAVSSWARS